LAAEWIVKLNRSGECHVTEFDSEEFSESPALVGGMVKRASAQQTLKPANGGSDPYPIPWLDRNGSHNQPAGPNLEPSHIFHFKGLVARCSTFTGMGTDNHGKRISFGSPTTDYGLMQGEYWAARTTQHGAFAHI
jgi:hypothetical protein